MQDIQIYLGKPLELKTNVQTLRIVDFIVKISKNVIFIKN